MISPNREDISASKMVPGLLYWDCAGSINSWVPKHSKVSDINETAMKILLRLYLTPALSPFEPRVNCPYAPTTPTVHVTTISRFPWIFFQFFCRTFRHLVNRESLLTKEWGATSKKLHTNTNAIFLKCPLNLQIQTLKDQLCCHIYCILLEPAFSLYCWRFPRSLLIGVTLPGSPSLRSFSVVLWRSKMEVHVRLKNAFPGGIGNRLYNTWFAYFRTGGRLDGARVLLMQAAWSRC